MLEAMAEAVMVAVWDCVLGTEREKVVVEVGDWQGDTV